jgi:hypothetical protein
VIVRTVGSELWLFDQRDHSSVCGAMAEAWGADPFTPLPDDVRRAADTHDAGWPEWDRSPRLNARTGQPHPYSDMPAADYRRIWERGLERGWEQGDRIGLLVSLHGMRFFARKESREDREMVDREHARQQSALVRLVSPAASVDSLPEPYATWHEWMFCWDALSLFLCEGWEQPWTRRIPARPGGGSVELKAWREEDRGVGGTLHVAPNAWVRTFTVDIPVRIIPAREYGSQQELDDALGSRRHGSVTWTIAGTPG